MCVFDVCVCFYLSVSQCVRVCLSLHCIPLYPFNKRASRRKRKRKRGRRKRKRKERISCVRFVKLVSFFSSGCCFQAIPHPRRPGQKKGREGWMGGWMEKKKQIIERQQTNPRHASFTTTTTCFLYSSFPRGGVFTYSVKRRAGQEKPLRLGHLWDHRYQQSTGL